MKNSTSLKWLAINSQKQSKKMTLLIIANAIFSFLTVAFAFFIKEIIDSAVEYKDKTRLLYFSLGIVGVVLLQFLLRLFINGMSEHIKARFEIDFKSKAFNDILAKKYDKISVYHSGELLNRLTNDVSVVSDGLSSILPTVVSAGARLISAIVALIVLDWVFAVAFTVAGVLVFLVITLLRKKLKSFHRKTQETEGKVRSFMQECIENLLAVKSFSVNDKIEEKSKDLQQDNFKVKMKRKNYSVFGHATYNIIFSAGYLFALIYGCVMILTAGLTYGALSAILQLVNNVQVPFASLSNVMPKYYAMLSSAERLMELEDIEKEDLSNYLDSNVYDRLLGINLTNVSFFYDRDMVLKDASTYIKKGEFVAITGASGEGKSTLIKLLLGVYTTKEGNVTLDIEGGENIALSPHTRSLFAFVPQGNMIFSGSILDNVTFIKTNATKEEIDYALKVSCADQFISQFPEGLNTLVGENGVGLSEGQIQRIAIARAVLTGAPILLLDEATSALDAVTEEKVLNNIKQLVGVTVIIISHKNKAVAIADRRLELKNKKISEV